MRFPTTRTKGPRQHPEEHRMSDQPGYAHFYRIFCNLQAALGQKKIDPTSRPNSLLALTLSQKNETVFTAFLCRGRTLIPATAGSLLNG
jgi:hypothetical protein